MRANVDMIGRHPHHVRSFAPIITPDARVLVLGSMPGKASLAAGQYYAHPRNAFWSIMGGLFEFDYRVAYEQRVVLLSAARVALWDVLASCYRPGSMDADIDDGSLVVNDFAWLFGRCPDIGAVFFNGAKAEQTYRRHVLPALDAASQQLPLYRLPSTSPANARLSLAAKRAQWRGVAEHASSAGRRPTAG